MTADDIYTVAGNSSGTSGDTGDGGAASSAKLNGPTGIAFDSAGDLYLSEGGDDTLRMVAAQNQTRVERGARGLLRHRRATVGHRWWAGRWRPRHTRRHAHRRRRGGRGSAGDVYSADYDGDRIQETAATSSTQWGQIDDRREHLHRGRELVGKLRAHRRRWGGHLGQAARPGRDRLRLGRRPLHRRRRKQPDPRGARHLWHPVGPVDDRRRHVHHRGSSSGTAGSSGDGGAATSAKLSAPAGIAFDASGDLYIADYGNNRIQEVPAASGTQWGQSMTADDIYTVAGSSSGTAGHSGDGGAATSATLTGPIGVALDASGDLYIADYANHRVQEVAHASGTQWGQSMTADDIYTVVGSASATEGDSGVGGPATSALLDLPFSVAIDSAGNLYLSDSGNAVVDEVPAASGTDWGQSMTADDLYLVAGGGTTAPSATDPENGEPAIDVDLANGDIAFDPAGDLLVADGVQVGEVVAPTIESVSTPSGWTLQSSESSGATTTDVYTRALASSDTGVTLDYALGATPKVASLAVYRGVNSSSPIDASSVGATSSGTSVAAASLSTTNAGDELVFIGGGTGQGTSPTWSAPSGMASVTTTSTSGVADVIADGPGPVPAGSTGSTSASTSSSGALSAIELALAPGAVTTTTAYDADDEATLVTDPDGNATLTCYDGDGNVAETVPPVGVAADSLSASSCPTAYPTDYGDRLATDATDHRLQRARRQDDRHHAGARRPVGLRDDDLRLRPGRPLTSVTAPPTSTSGGATTT